MKLIDKDALIADLDKGLWGKDWDKALAEAIINEAPTIDLIRCRECANRTDRVTKLDGKGYCGLHHGWSDDDDYCSFGELYEDIPMEYFESGGI